MIDIETLQQEVANASDAELMGRRAELERTREVYRRHLSRRPDAGLEEAEGNVDVELHIVQAEITVRGDSTC